MKHKNYRDFDDYTRKQKAQVKEILDACRNLTMEQAILLQQTLNQMIYLSMHKIEDVETIKTKTVENEQEFV